MNLVSIFALQFVLSTLILAVVARWYLAPWLGRKPISFALTILIAPHAFRHLGMSFLVPGLTSDTLPVGFATAAAYGDLISGFLAIAALIALRLKWRIAIPVVWVFSIFGLGDLLHALSHAEAIPHLGTAWLIPTFVVPGLLVTHWMVLACLARQATVERRARPAAGQIAASAGVQNAGGGVS